MRGGQLREVPEPARVKTGELLDPLEAIADRVETDRETRGGRGNTEVAVEVGLERQRVGVELLATVLSGHSALGGVTAAAALAMLIRYIGAQMALPL